MGTGTLTILSLGCMRTLRITLTSMMTMMTSILLSMITLRDSNLLTLNQAPLWEKPSLCHLKIMIPNSNSMMFRENPFILIPLIPTCQLLITDWMKSTFGHSTTQPTTRVLLRTSIFVTYGVLIKKLMLLSGE